MAPSRIAALEELLAKEPDDVTTHYMLAHEYFKAQMYERAALVLRRYLSLTDDEGAAYRILAQALLHLERFDEARQAYRDGLAAASRHHHQPMIEEYTRALEDLA